MSAIDRVKELLAAKDSNVQSRRTIALSQLSALAIPLAEELVASQEVLKKVTQVECDDLIHFSLIGDPENCDPDCIRCPVEAALRLKKLEGVMKEER